MPKRSTLKLTKRIVEKLKAEDKDAIYWDGELQGFDVWRAVLAARGGRIAVDLDARCITFLPPPADQEPPA